MAKRKWYPYESREPFDSEGVNQGWLIHHLSHGKEGSDDSPYLIPNEWIAGNIAQFLRLPIPPFALTRNDPTHKGMFASLRFGHKKESQPKDMRPEPCVRNDPKLCAGILIFDIYVANGDRHRGNLKVDDPVNPKEFDVFDHDRALFHIEKDKGAKRLMDSMDALGVSSGSGAGHSPHCLLEVVESANDFEEWIQKISTIPDWFIEDICHEVNDWLSEEEISAAIMFLKYRKKALAGIVSKHKHKFTKVRNWGTQYE